MSYNHHSMPNSAVTTHSNNLKKALDKAIYQDDSTKIFYLDDPEYFEVAKALEMSQKEHEMDY